MKKIVCGIAAAMALPSLALAAADVQATYLNREDSMIGYYGNTAVKFIPGEFEEHSWYMKNGILTVINAVKAADGTVTLKVSEGKWKFDDGYRPRTIAIDGQGKDGVALELNNYFPGQTWRMLLPEGSVKGWREIWTILPGHQ